MAIHSIFPTNIYVKDFDLDDSFTATLKLFSKHLVAMKEAQGENYNNITNDASSIFAEANMLECPELRQLRDMFIEGFADLAESYDVNTITREELANPKLWTSSDKLTYMKTGDYKACHTHSLSYAYGIFYFDDIDNDKDGGELILHDPKFSSQDHFSCAKTHHIPTKKNRMVIAPNYLWHEVSKYSGSEDRIGIVLSCDSNLDYFRSQNPV